VRGCDTAGHEIIWPKNQLVFIASVSVVHHHDLRMLRLSALVSSFFRECATIGHMAALENGSLNQTLRRLYGSIRRVIALSAPQSSAVR